MSVGVRKGMKVILNPTWGHRNWYSRCYWGETGVITAIDTNDNSELPIIVRFDNGDGQFVSKYDIEIVSEAREIDIGRINDLF